MPRARKKQASWSYTAGEKGVNRVRVFVHRTGKLFAEYKQDGRKVRQSLGHTDQRQAKEEADLLASQLRGPKQREPISLGLLFDNYLREETPKKTSSTQNHDRLAIELFLRVFGANRMAEELTHRDADNFATQRRLLGDLRQRAVPENESSGKVAHFNIGPRVISRDLKLLKTILNWGVGAGWLTQNPLQSYRVVEEGTPKRPFFIESQYQSLLTASAQFPWQFRSLLVLAHETGHRIGAIRNLRWRDIDFAAARITWRQETDKIGYEHQTPMSPGAREVLEAVRQLAQGTGSNPVIPSPSDPLKPISKGLARDWMERGQIAAGLPPERGRGWHGFRRNFASELRDVGLRDLCDLGGWKDPTTVVRCYQRPSEEAMRTALERRIVLEA